jgi:ribosomal protein L37AE/L43A
MELKIKFCPKCKSGDINGVAGGQMGIWECGNCGFRSTIFPEKIVNTQDIEEKNIKNGKRKKS